MEPDEYHLMDAAEDGMWWYRALHARVLDALGSQAAPVLDAGCGTGGFLARLAAARPGQPLYGLEYNPGAAARAQAKSGARVAVASVHEIPFADASFGAVTSMDVLSHSAVDPALALPELVRVLRPGGRLVLNLPAFQWLHSAHDARVHNARRFTAGQARALLEGAGLRTISVRYWNALLLPLMVLQRKLLANAPDDRSDVAAFSPWLDASLHGVTQLERGLASLGLPFPAGGSILAVGHRP